MTALLALTANVPGDTVAAAAQSWLVLEETFRRNKPRVTLISALIRSFLLMGQALKEYLLA